MDSWQQYNAIKRLLETYNMLNMTEVQYEEFNSELLAILGLGY